MNITRLLTSFFASRRQNRFDTSAITSARKLIIFLIPAKCSVNGGVMSIFNMCRITRELQPNSCILIATEPSNYTYDKNTWFENSEKIFRFSQLLPLMHSAQSVIIHIPDYFAGKFTSSLSVKEKNILKAIPELHLNILNQNIELMPSPDKTFSLFELTTHVTQTTAHNRYATQEICNTWGLPLHHFSVKLTLPKVYHPSFSEKLNNKIIAISKDKHHQKQDILDMITKKLPDYKIITIKKMTYTEYHSLIARSMFVITFGEGFDAYFTQPCRAGSVGITVYNDKFFPSPKWKELDNVYLSYNELYENFANDVRHWEKDESYYTKIAQTTTNECNKLYSYDKFCDNLKRFYQGKYDFMPQK